MQVVAQQGDLNPETASQDVAAGSEWAVPPGTEVVEHTDTPVITHPEEPITQPLQQPVATPESQPATNPVNVPAQDAGVPVQPVLNAGGGAALADMT